LKLLVLTTSWPANAADPSGAFVAESTHYLTRHGFDCTVVALEIAPPGALAAFESGQWHTLLAPVTRMALKAQSREFDAVLSHWLLPSAVIGASLGLPQVGVAHGGDFRLLKKYPSLKSWLVKHLDGLVAVTPEYVEDLGVKDSLLMPMGVDSSQLGPPLPMPAPEPLRLLFLGRLIPIKGLSLLIDAVTGLKGVELTIAGDGSERYLEDTAPENVRFIGAVSMTERKRLFSEHHVLCLPSRPGDASPRVVAEAIASGRPVLASDLPGIRSRVPESWRVPCGNVFAWRTAIQRLKNSPAEVRPFLSPDVVDWCNLVPQFAAFQRHVFGKKKRRSLGAARWL